MARTITEALSDTSPGCPIIVHATLAASILAGNPVTDDDIAIVNGEWENAGTNDDGDLWLDLWREACYETIGNNSRLTNKDGTPITAADYVTPIPYVSDIPYVGAAVDKAQQTAQQAGNALGDALKELGALGEVIAAAVRNAVWIGLVIGGLVIAERLTRKGNAT
jgi:hypothetical protein